MILRPNPAHSWEIHYQSPKNRARSKEQHTISSAGYPSPGGYRFRVALVDVGLLAPSPSRSASAFGRRFVVRVLRHEFAAHGEVEDGLAELLDLVGARGQRRQRVEHEAGVVPKGFRIGHVEAGEACRRQPVAHRLAASPRRLQSLMASNSPKLEVSKAARTAS